MIRRLHVPPYVPGTSFRILPKQEAHWRPGYSAHELVTTWANAGTNFPNRIREVLNTAPEYLEAQLIDGFFEREVDLGTPGRNSQTDLMVVAGIGSELAIIAIEGKAEELFADIVSVWNDSAGKQRRLNHLCNTLHINPAQAGPLRYQLLHRTASALYEAERYRSRQALMVVHSFSTTHRWFNDFAAFSRVLQMPLDQPNRCSVARKFAGISLRLAWVSDVPQSS